MATKGTDLLLARRRAKASTLDIAEQMGVTRQYVSKLESADEVTPDAAEKYRAALHALEGQTERVQIEIAGLPNDYRVAGRKVRGKIRQYDRRAQFLVLATPTTPWAPLLATLDSLAAIGASHRVVVLTEGTDPETLKRVG
jgi:transcriptional regulator with XRE-family HTH domain